MSRVFEHFPNDAEFVCPICKKNDDSPCWLMPIDGTQEDNIEQATPVHVKCTGEELIGKMRFNRKMKIVYAFVENND